MKFAGTITELELDLEDYHHDIDQAVVTKNRIAMDWEEDGEKFHAVLTSTDGVNYEGNFGLTELDKKWKMDAAKYTAADKDVLLLLKWIQTDSGDEGSCIVILEPSA